MAVAYAQGTRPITVQTPLGQDVLLLVGLKGREAISELFRYEVELLAENTKNIAFEKILGQKVNITFTLPGDKKRHINGICVGFSQGDRDSTFTTYHMEIVPRLWFLTRRVQSRIFQYLTVPDILKKVLEGLDISVELQGSFEKRDYCVQYRESDFNFACRLMEEEGIYFFFKHTADGHKMVIANASASSPALPDHATITFENMEGGTREEDRIHSWRKSQEIRSGKITLWDHSFEFPGNNLQAQATVSGSVQVGKVSHPLVVGGNNQLEIYDFPGAYAQRFDGIDRGGAEHGEAAKIFRDKDRTVGLRLQEESAAGLLVHGTGNCRHLVPGHKFTLTKHFNADGDYLFLSTEIHVRRNDYRSNEAEGFQVLVRFVALPFAQPYRPARTHTKPTVAGSQTATVVGPAGEEIFTDKYGRIKVQMNWDREGKKNADSSCWVRVGTPWAGKQWGMIHIPRIGQEVIVDFLEGDPDQPICVGSVFNAEQMPPYELPANKTQSGIKTRSSLGGSPANFNEIRFEDKKGDEQLFIHAEKNQDIEVENDETHWVGHDRRMKIDHDKFEHVMHNKKIEVDVDHEESVKGSMTIGVGKNLTETIALNYMETVGVAMELTVGAALVISVGAAMTETIGGSKTVAMGGSMSETIAKTLTLQVGKSVSHKIGESQTVEIAKDLTETIKGKHREEVTKDYSLQAEKVQIVAKDEISIKTGKAEIVMKKNGDITIKGNKINVKGDGDVVIKGSAIKEN